MIDDVFSLVSDGFQRVQQGLFEGVMQPIVFHLGMGNLLEDAYAATGWLLVGLIQIAILVVLVRQLERWRPVEPTTDRAAIRVDILYTLLHRLGLFRLALFFTIDPWWDTLFGKARLAGWSTTWQLDAAIAPWWPGVTDTAWFAFFAYLLAFDFVDYWVHRGQHGLRWWWALHSLHHSQRQMTLWSDSRNHLLDDLLRDSAMVLLAHVIGIAPGQFVAVVALTQLVEHVSHANARVWWGALLERVIVSPRFHRLHHAIGIGHETRGRGTLGGHNFAVLFPIWDVLFGTANFEHRYDPTGVRDQLEAEGGRDYGRGFWSQQWLGIRRLVGRA